MRNNVTKSQLVKILKKSIKGNVEEIVDKLFQLMSASSVNGDSLKMSNFGFFRLGTKKARIGTNPGVSKNLREKIKAALIDISIYKHRFLDIERQCRVDEEDKEKVIPISETNKIFMDREKHWKEFLEWLEKEEAKRGTD